MFGGSKTRAPRMDTMIGPNTRISGDLQFESGLLIDGEITGNLLAENSGSRVVVNEPGKVIGEVKVPVVVIDGTVEGDVYANERLELGTHARINGNVFYNLIEMAEGATVNGKLVHKPNQTLLLELKSSKHGEENNSSETASSAG